MFVFFLGGDKAIITKQRYSVKLAMFQNVTDLFRTSLVPLLSHSTSDVCPAWFPFFLKKKSLMIV